MPQPLPPNPYAIGSREFNAYALCMALEANPPSTPLSHPGPSYLVCARLLGYMIMYAPTQQGRNHISDEVLLCKNDSDKLELAYFYINHFLRFFRSTKGQTPASSDSLSRSFDNLRDAFKNSLEEAPVDHRSAKKKALQRDAYHCAITGNCDSRSFNDRVPAVAQWRGKLVPTNAAHILPPSTNQGLGMGGEGEVKGEVKRDYAGTVWAIIERYGGVNVGQELNGPNIHRLENPLTMDPIVHIHFDSLLLWLKPTVPPAVNTYRLHAIDPQYLLDLPATITFTSAVRGLPLPDPRYLALHTACAEVTHLSGAGKYVDSILEETADMNVLAPDGSSASVLEIALWSGLRDCNLGVQ